MPKGKKNPSQDLIKSQDDVEHVDDVPVDAPDEQDKQDELSSLTPGSSDVSADPSVAAGSETASPTGKHPSSTEAVLERMANMMFMQHELIMQSFVQQQKTAQDSSQRVEAAIMSLADKLSELNNPRNKRTSSSVKVTSTRKRRQLPLTFGAIEGQDESSAGEGDESGKDEKSFQSKDKPSMSKFDPERESGSKTPRKMVGVKSKPETLVSTPALQDKFSEALSSVPAPQDKASVPIEEPIPQKLSRAESSSPKG